tara:strand:+ start:476 stop:796 length:321 start_codon:yes stop_codon:yes gene_type:complete
VVVFFVNIGEVLPSLRVVVVVVVVVEEEEVAAAAAVAVIVARLSLPVEVVVNNVGFEADERDLREEVLLVLVEFVAAVPRFKGRVQALILELDELEVVLDRDRSES